MCVEVLDSSLGGSSVVLWVGKVPSRVKGLVSFFVECPWSLAL